MRGSRLALFAASIALCLLGADKGSHSDGTPPPLQGNQSSAAVGVCGRTTDPRAGDGSQPRSERNRARIALAGSEALACESRALHRAANSEELHRKLADALDAARQAAEDARDKLETLTRSLRAANGQRVYRRFYGRVGGQDNAVVMHNGERYRYWRGELCGPERGGCLYLSIVQPAFEPVVTARLVPESLARPAR